MDRQDRAPSAFDHPNLAVERAQSTFNEGDMTDFLNGSEAETRVQTLQKQVHALQSELQSERDTGEERRRQATFLGATAFFIR